MERERKFQDVLIELFKTVIRQYRFEGLEFQEPEPEFPLDSRSVDIALFLKGHRPFLFIETKKQGLKRVQRKMFDVFSPTVIGQAISYVHLYKKMYGSNTPYFATANPEKIAIFKTPENLEEYIDEKQIEKRNYSLVLKKGKLSELIENFLIIRESVRQDPSWAQSLLDRLAKDYLKKKEIKAQVTFALIDQLRSFAWDVTREIKELVEIERKKEPLKTKIEKAEEELGTALSTDHLAKMMAYVLMNKIIFYKILEANYKIHRLVSLDISNNIRFKQELNYYFNKAMEETRDFEPIFSVGLYDLIPIPDDPDFMERINDFISFLDNVNIDELGELLGYIYEELIPPDERHRLGQFYTPPAICEFITRWSIRGSDDKVMDPGCGSGGFILQAYKELLRQKTGKTIFPVKHEIHKRILDQLYAIDLNPFPAQLTAINLALKNVRAPSTNLNVIVRDFFSIRAIETVWTPYTIKTQAGDIKRKVTISKMDAVIGNPPYTRWTEIPEETKSLIKKVLEKKIKNYKLTPAPSRGIEPGIYVYWIMHATEFLKNKGRLGMIISNLWMQTDYGINFGNFLLDNYKIKGIIDFTIRLFDALISTCILLLEKEENRKEREENEIVFVHIPGKIEKINVEELLKIMDTKESDKYYVKTIKQKDMPRDKKWIEIFMSPSSLEEKLFRNNLLVKVGDIFEVSRGNTIWSLYALTHGKRPDPGASDFHYITPSKAEEFNLSNHLNDRDLFYPALTSSRNAKFFTFTENDWEELRKKDAECYMFIGHKKRDKLPEEIKEYIKWGETECRTKIRGTRGGGRLCKDTESAKARERSNEFFGWYDLGGVIVAPLFAIRQARYKTRFILSRYPIAMYDALIALIPKHELDENQLKSLLVFLNSSFIQYYIELKGRYIAKGPISLDPNKIKEMPIVDISKLSQREIKLLSKKFDELEAEARRIGGASKREQIEKLKPKIYEIDEIIAKILGFSEKDVKLVQEMVEMLVERRVREAKEPKPESVIGSDMIKYNKPKKKRTATKKEPRDTKLDLFMNPKNT